MIRALGFVLILSGASCVGIRQAACIRRACRLYEDLRIALVWLKNEIQSALTPLEQAFDQVSGLIADPLSSLFAALAQKIRDDPGCSTVGLAARYFASRPEMPPELLDVVYDLLRMLGRQDTAAQVNALELALSRTELLRKRLEQDKTERCRSYRTLGICAGLALAVILI